MIEAKMVEVLHVILAMICALISRTFFKYLYNIFSKANVAYSDLNKTSDTIDIVASTKEIRIKNNTQQWFDNEIAEAIKITEKYFKKFKKSNLQIDYNFYTEVKCNTHKLIKQKKLTFLIQN